MTPATTTPGGTVTVTWSVRLPSPVTRTTLEVVEARGTAQACPVQPGVVRASGARAGLPPVAAVYSASCTVASGAPAGAYQARVTVRDGSGSSFDEAVGSLAVTAAVPWAPSGVVATVGAHGVELAWSPPAAGSPAVSGYAVFRGATPGLEGTTAVASTAATQFLDPRGAGTYYYVVRAVGASGQSTASAEVSAVVAPAPVPAASPAAGAPTPPTGPTAATPTTATTLPAGPAPLPAAAPPTAAPPSALHATATRSVVALGWTPPPGVPVLGYYVYRGVTPGGESGAAVFTTSTTFDDLTAMPGVRYYYLVEAMSAAGLSVPSNEAVATGAGPPVPAASVPPAPAAASGPMATGAVSGTVVVVGAPVTGPAPVAPTGLTATVSGTGISLRWGVPSGAPVSEYYVYRGMAGVWHAAITSAVPSFTDLSVVGGLTYSYLVQAMTATGLSVSSNEVSATVGDPAPVVSVVPAGGFRWRPAPPPD